MGLCNSATHQGEGQSHRCCLGRRLREGCDETNARCHVDASMAWGHDAGAGLDIVRLRPRGARTGDEIRDRLRAPLIWVRSCAGDDCRGHLVRAARCTSTVVAAGGLAVVMAQGAFLGLIGLPLPGVEMGIALSALLLGAMVGGEVRPKPVVAALLVGGFAVFHGHAHGTELPAGQGGLLYSMGFVIATGCLHGLGIALGLFHRWPTGKLALRGAGALIATMGVLFLWRALT